MNCFVLMSTFAQGSQQMGDPKKSHKLDYAVLLKSKWYEHKVESALKWKAQLFFEKLFNQSVIESYQI